MNASIGLQQLPNPEIAHVVSSFESGALTDEIPEIETVMENTTQAIEDAQELKDELKMNLAYLLLKKFMDNCVC